MTDYLNDRIYDSGLGIFNAEANRLDICSSQPATFAEVATYTLGNKTTPTISTPAARTPSGRKVSVTAIADGSVTGTGTAAYYTITDTVNSRLLAAGRLSASQAVTSGNTFTLTGFDIGIPGPA